MTEHGGGLLANAHFWYTVSFVVFVGIMYKVGRRPVANLLDAEIAKVRDSLEQAKRLRAEAEAQLVSCREKEKAASKEAAEIISQAQKEAADIRARAEQELKALLVRQEELVVNRIQQIEAEAIAEVRSVAIDLAMEETRKVIVKKLDVAAANRVTDEAINEIRHLSKSTVL